MEDEAFIRQMAQKVLAPSNRTKTFLDFFSHIFSAKHKRKKAVQAIATWISSSEKSWENKEMDKVSCKKMILFFIEN